MFIILCFDDIGIILLIFITRGLSSIFIHILQMGETEIKIFMLFIWAFIWMHQFRWTFLDPVIWQEIESRARYLYILLFPSPSPLPCGINRCQLSPPTTADTKHCTGLDPKEPLMFMQKLLLFKKEIFDWRRLCPWTEDSSMNRRALWDPTY